MKRTLVCGVTGQDGAYLARLLLEKGYEVWGTSRDPQMADLVNLKRLGIDDRITLISMAPSDFRSVLNAVSRSQPAEIYGLAGQSSVGLSFELPVETLESVVLGALNLMEAIRFVDRSIRFYHAGSSECFGSLDEGLANETTPFRPRSPYGVAKSSAHMLVANYREAYNLFACNGVLFNHESPLRPTRFVTKKIARAACRIAGGLQDRLHLGRLDIIRDWGWAPEFVDAMWRMLQQDAPDDYVVATGRASSLADFVAAAFSAVALDWHDFVTIDPSLGRPTDLVRSCGDPGKAHRELGWRAQTHMEDVARLMVEAELDNLQKSEVEQL